MTVGVEMAKNVFQFHWVDARTTEIVNKKLKHAGVTVGDPSAVQKRLAAMLQSKPTVVGAERLVASSGQPRRGATQDGQGVGSVRPYKFTPDLKGRRLRHCVRPFKKQLTVYSGGVLQYTTRQYQ
jgi:hypothetical protein